MAQFMVAVGTTLAARAGPILEIFKGAAARHGIVSDWCSVTVLQGAHDPGPQFAIDAEAGRWLAWVGTWFHPDAPGATAVELLRILRGRELSTVASRLEGFFAILVGDDTERKVRVVTDHCGSCHVFSAPCRTGVLISTSSAALAAAISSRTDPVGVQEFVATGNVYGDRTLWEGVRKLPPASVCVFGSHYEGHSSYWSFEQLQPERLALDDAVRAVSSGLIETAAKLGRRFKRPVCDVTGGYDSRACLTGLLAAGVRVDATVSGPESSGDVRVSKEIATTFGLRHIHSPSAYAPTLDDITAAMRLTDGEYDAFDYARIRATHLGLSVDHDVSINGSFGELGRGYWWELLLPYVGRRAPIDVRRIIAARFTAGAHPACVFAPGLAPGLAEHMEQVAADAISSLSRFPNTTQLDCVYYTLRMQRWQGRIASSTHQIWPCLSPLSFPSVLVPMLETKAIARLGGRLVRELIHRLNPVLAAINLEHGYPAQPLRASNFVRFLPLVGLMARRTIAKGRRVIARRLSLGSAATRAATSSVTSPLHTGGEEIRTWLTEPLLLETGLFERQSLHDLLAKPAFVTGVGTTWTRLVTMELLLRDLARVRATSCNSGPTNSPGAFAAVDQLSR